MPGQLTLTDLNSIKDHVVPLALEVGTWALNEQVEHQRGRTDMGVSTKTSPGDVVTRVDVESQLRISQALRAAYPTHGLLGEEGLQAFGDAHPVWVIDPIDGTFNFVRGYPGFCVSIGLVQGGESVLGAIYDSVSGGVYWAVKGGGAWRGAERLRLQEDRPLSHSLIATNFTESMRDDRAQQAFFGRVSGGSAGVRASGAAARDFCLVAEGHIDLFWQFGLRSWDVAAGAVIGREAGATFEFWRGRGDWLRSSGVAVAAGTPRVLAEARAVAAELGLVEG